MFQTPIACDPNLLQLSLEERLSETQEATLIQHLSQCEHCQRELERLAGRQHDWSKVGSALKYAAEHSSSVLRPHGEATDVGGDAEWGEWDDETAADFAVDFLEPSPTSDVMGRLGDIDVIEIIGSGGMGLVLKGHQAELKRLVAVKVLSPHLAVSGAARKRFAREAQAAAAILHPNVMPILTVNSAGKLPYLVMPYLAGESLEQRIRRVGPLELPDLLRIGFQTAQGLAAAHAQGLIHRDVKPANILLERGVERVMLTDFGLARAIDDASITRTGFIAGTPQYMSPEQARGEPLDARSDLFSLGSVLYTMATGRAPFRADSTYGILRRIADDEPCWPREVNPQTPEWLAAIIAKLLAKRPADRFGSATEVGALLQECLAHVQQPQSVKLPDECQRLSAKRAGVSTSRWRHVRRAVTAALIVLPIVMLPLISGRTSTPEPATQTTAVFTQPAADAPQVESTAETAWDAPGTEWVPLRHDGERFEQRARRLWDQEPQPLRGAAKQR